MILVIGLHTDKTARYTVSRALQKSQSVAFVDLSEFLHSGSLEFRSSRSESLVIRIRDIELDLFSDEITGIYLRLILPKVADSDSHRIGTKFNALYNILHELPPHKTVNHPIHDLSNSNRLIHLATLSECGFAVGSSLSTSDSSAARKFTAGDGKFIYKSNSSIKTVASALTYNDYDRLDDVEFCPTVLQRRIFGSDVRVHWLDGKLFPLEVETNAVDYRYSKESRRTVLESVPFAVEHAIQKYAARSSLRFIGFDFKIERTTGKWYCLEANPMPGYESYDRAASGAISDFLLQRLAQPLARADGTRLPAAGAPIA